MLKGLVYFSLIVAALSAASLAWTGGFDSSLVDGGADRPLRLNRMPQAQTTAVPEVAATPTPDLLAENQILKEELEAYKDLEEELMAQRVFDRARDRLFLWISFGGIFVFLGGIAGFKWLIDKTKQIAEGYVEGRIKEISKSQLEEALQRELEKQIAEYVEEREAGFDAYVRQQLSRITVAGMPIGQQEAVQPRLQIKGKIDYSLQLLPIRDQKNEGGSVGFAVAAAMEYQIFKILGKQVVISPRYIYYQARLLGGMNVEADTGAHIRDAIQVLARLGAVLEEDWPYTPGEYDQPPPANIDQAEHFKIAKYVNLQSLEELKTGLEQFGPIPGGISIFKSLFSSGVAKTGVVPMPDSDENVMAGHAVCFVGYDDEQRLLKFRNSWGQAWGDSGYGYFPYAYIEKFLMDAWGIVM